MADFHKGYGRDMARVPVGTFTLRYGARECQYCRTCSGVSLWLIEASHSRSAAFLCDNCARFSPSLKGARVTLPNPFLQ